MPDLLPSPLLATSAEQLADEAQSPSRNLAPIDMDDLRCPICFAVMLAPRVLPGCNGNRSHSFCAPCITFWLQLQRDSGLPPTCPIDRRVVKDGEQITRNPALEEAIARILVRCPNSRLGCSARFELGEGSAHLDVCAFRTIQCPLCAKPQSAEGLAKHMERCFRACDKCGINVPRTDSLMHNMSLCLAREHHPWWPASHANAFTIFRDATEAQLGWLLDRRAAVTDWRRANESLIAMLEEQVVPTMVVAGSAAEPRGEQEEDEAGEEDEEGEEGEEGVKGEGESAPPAPPTWKDALELLRTSAPLCLELAAVCRQRGWRAPWLALSVLATELDPVSIEAKLRSGEALLDSGKASEACEAFDAVLQLDEDKLEAVGGQALGLEMLGRGDEAKQLWARLRAAPMHAAPVHTAQRSRWHVACARARVAFGDCASAEDLLLSFLHRHDHVDAQSEYATVLELSYLFEVDMSGVAGAAVPQPPPSSEGRDKLSSAYDAWSTTLKLSPNDARATARLALVEHELAVTAYVVLPSCPPHGMCAHQEETPSAHVPRSVCAGCAGPARVRRSSYSPRQSTVSRAP